MPEIQNSGHSGNYSVQLAGPGSLSQTVVVPNEAALSLLYKVSGSQHPADHLVVRVQTVDFIEVSATLPLTATVWTHAWLDVSALAGQSVQVSIELTSSTLSVDVDAVTLGFIVRGSYPVLIPTTLR